MSLIPPLGLLFRISHKTGSEFISNVLALILVSVSQHESIAVNHKHERKVYHDKKEEKGVDDDIL